MICLFYVGLKARVCFFFFWGGGVGGWRGGSSGNFLWCRNQGLFKFMELNATCACEKDSVSGNVNFRLLRS